MAPWPDRPAWSNAVTWNVKGTLFADYVRMVRAHKDVDWSRYLRPEDRPWLEGKIERETWYPMAVFERLGNGILREVADGDLEAVRLWGRFSVDALVASYPTLVAEGDPVDTLRRFRVLRSTFFDFEALEVPMLHEGAARVLIHYHMGDMAEEAASFQTMGFFERLLEVGGAQQIRAHFSARSWAGDPCTTMDLAWSSTG